MASGYATLGVVGAASRFDYTAIGNSINLAARLYERAGDGEILVNRRVFADAEEAATIEPAGEMPLKGFERPVEVFRVLS